MKRNRIACAALLAAVFAASTVFLPPAQAQGPGSAEFFITARGKGSRAVPTLEQKDVSVQLKNQPANITLFEPARGANARLQLVFLFDESAPSYLSLQIPSLRKFMEALPPNVEVAVAYMANGRAVMAQTLTPDHALAAKSLRLTTSIPGVSASPYFCLSSLAKHWPAPYQAGTRRVVFMVTNGEDPYYGGRNLQDPYVQAAIRDSQKAGLMVYSIYFRDVGFRGSLGVLFGQSYLAQVADNTGGELYAEALSSPVSFDPYLQQFRTSLENQYGVTIAAQGNGLERFKVKSNLSGVKIAAATAVNLGGVK